MSAKIPEAIRRIFTESFIARDIAEPLASFDAGTSATEVRGYMQAKDLEVVGIRKNGEIAGFALKHSLEDGPCGASQRPLNEARVLSDGASLLNVLTEMNHAPFLFITVLGTVGGVITPADLQKPPVRMWVFGIVTLIEMRCMELIERHCPSDSWKEYVSEGRLQKAQALLDERSRRYQTVRLIDCLQFSDKGQIIARNEGIRQQTIFTSRRQAEDAIKKLELLRNNIAHAQDIAKDDLETIVQLCDFVTRQYGIAVPSDCGGMNHVAS
jgi:hypothetical protein